MGSSSTLNVSTAGQVIAATTIVPVDSNGNIAIYAQPSTHLVVDLSGWFTDRDSACLVERVVRAAQRQPS